MKWTPEREDELRTFWREPGATIVSVAHKMGLTRGSVDGKSRVMGLQFHRPSGGSGGRRVGIGSPADVLGTTVFQNMIRHPDDNVLKSADNQRKIGRMIRKGKWKGFAVFSLTLEERKTCPRSCQEWLSCYGGNMGRSVRYEHGAALETEIWKELRYLQGKHPQGFAIRLHLLGDFYSVEYVRFWERALDKFPALHVFGYTARNWKAGNPDPIGVAVADLRDRCWDRFAVRTSGAHSGPRTKVIEHARDKGKSVICPAQTHERTCSSCALCWDPAFKNKSISFLRH